MKSNTVPDFWSLYRQLPPAIRQAAQSAYSRFAGDPLHPSLHFHRLTSDPRLWSVRVSRNYRAVGRLQADTITWFWIGDHDDFDRAFPN